MTAPFHVMIPARYGSTRLPGKVLLPLAGRPMIEHVWQRARSSGAASVTIATDDARVAQAAEGFGATVSLTRGNHASGTDRINEVVSLQRWSDETIVVNVQGDEPLMPPALIAQVAAALDRSAWAHVATARTAIHDESEWRDPNVVKTVVDARDRALYFSRAPIPWPRDALANPEGLRGWRHLGIYAYRAGTLRALSELPPCDLERTESLEQLRALWNGMNITVVEATAVPEAGVDTMADLQRVDALMTSQREG